MGTLSAYMFISLNGFYKGKDDDISWNRHGQEEASFSNDSLKQENILVFGRRTYEMMAAFWTSDAARTQMPDVAKGMNSARKIVVSNSLQQAAWENTSVLNTEIIESLTELKERYNLTILGSGELVASLATSGLIDRYDVMVNPVVLPEGTSFFDTIARTINLKLTDTKAFKSGVVMLSYQPE